MLPVWMENTDSYVPPRGGGTFAVKTIRSISAAVGKLQFQQGRERKPFLPAAVRLLLLFALILLLSLSRHLLALLAWLGAETAASASNLLLYQLLWLLPNLLITGMVGKS